MAPFNNTNTESASQLSMGGLHTQEADDLSNLFVQIDAPTADGQTTSFLMPFQDFLTASAGLSEAPSSAASTASQL